MAINKVQFGSNTLMDITDTTTETEDVIEGKVFYAKNGVRSVGSLGDATQSAHGLMSATDKEKLDSITAMTGATSSANGASGLVPSPTTEDVDKFLAGDGTYKSGGLPMVILSYGKSVWNDFINAYNNHVIVYCRASSNSNPATGAQGRMAFMAYVNNGDNPTEVEFQYYRSMSSHSSTQMGDQVFIYKLAKTGGWSVTVREASIKEISASATGNLSVSYSSNKVTLSGGLPAVTTTDNDKMLKVVNGVWTIVYPNTYSKTETDAAIAQSAAWSNNWLTDTSILEYAASVANPSFTTFRTSATSTDVPIANEYYIGTVERYGQNITVKMTTMQDASKMYINNSVNSGSTWTGWKTFLDSQSTAFAHSYNYNNKSATVNMTVTGPGFVFIGWSTAAYTIHYVSGSAAILVAGALPSGAAVSFSGTTLSVTNPQTWSVPIYVMSRP